MAIIGVILVSLALIAFCLLWPAAGEPWRWPGKPAEARQPDRPEKAAEPMSLEGALTAQLIAGKISQVEYRRAVERLAVRDEETYPLVAPDDPPSACQ
jgi:hypothetical protein